MSLYNLKSTATPLYSITKFTDDLDVEATYSVARTVCDCPAGARASCRHRQMLPILLERVDTAWFYDFDLKSWSDPTGEANKPATGDEAEIVDENEVGPSDNPYSDVAPQAEGYPLHPRAHTQSLEGAIESGAIKLVPEAPKPAPAFKRRL